MSNPAANSLITSALLFLLLHGYAHRCACRLKAESLSPRDRLPLLLPPLPGWRTISFAKKMRPILRHSPEMRPILRHSPEMRTILRHSHIRGIITRHASTASLQSWEQPLPTPRSALTSEYSARDHVRLKPISSTRPSARPSKERRPRPSRAFFPIFRARK